MNSGILENNATNGGGIFTTSTSYANIATTNLTCFGGSHASNGVYLFSGNKPTDIQDYAHSSLRMLYVINNFDIITIQSSLKSFYDMFSTDPNLA